MRRIILLVALTTLASTSLLAQQPIGNPLPEPATGAPGTATPHPYGMPAAPRHLPSAPANSVPLLKQPPLQERSQNRRDQGLQLLREQRERNAQPRKKPAE